MATQEFITHSAEETIALGRSLAGLLAPPKLVLLSGDLGAGKTTLVKGIAEAFQAASADDVTSPTFTLVHEYRGPRAKLYHIDLYRVDTPRQLETLGLDDLIADDSVLLIEWGEKFPRIQQQKDAERAGVKKKPGSAGLFSSRRSSPQRWAGERWGEALHWAAMPGAGGWSRAAADPDRCTRPA